MDLCIRKLATRQTNGKYSTETEEEEKRKGKEGLFMLKVVSWLGVIYTSKRGVKQ